MTWQAHQLGLVPDLQDLATKDVASVPPASCPRGSGTRPAAPHAPRRRRRPPLHALLDWLLAPLGPESRHGHLALASIDAVIAEHTHHHKETHDQAAVAAVRDAALPGARRAGTGSRKLELTDEKRIEAAPRALEIWGVRAPRLMVLWISGHTLNQESR